MTSTLIFLSFCTFLGQADGGEWTLAPQLAVGAELVYSGTCTEESLLPGVQYSRTYRVDNLVLVLAAENKSHDVAIVTTLSVREPGEAVKFSAASVKAEVATLDARGKLKLTGPAPALLEVGCFVECPATRVGRNSVWEVEDEGRPPRSWVVVGNEPCGGLACAKLQGQQQSEDWDRPRADRSAWRRRDVVWLSLQMGVAVKVERTIERRDPARREPSHRTTTHYVLESRLRYPGKLFDDRKREAIQAKRFADEAAPLLKQPARHAAALDALMRKMTYHLENSPATPYRKAVTHLVQRVEIARKGELLLAEYSADEPSAPIGPLRVGQKTPDAVLADVVEGKTVRLSRHLGRPILVVYFNPTTEIGAETLAFAKKTAEAFGDRASIVALAAPCDVERVRRQHAEMKLPFSIYDGQALRLTFAVDATPRFVVLDAEGCLRASLTGWAPHVGEEIVAEMGRCGRPGLP